ncbi:NADH dehydrogenase [ubiquinone] 1 beta subcomplex subunit 4 [Phlebotomus argentipes]|uniref:NADH dehydrogenase [ubiquinone] 1 beta subcomplex subunit 4 n=1 Tax=Phlebotomus argentipes TaxID=94469 RepID=UPI0028932F7F|nr:NADH dehydrogenase [ubiquinone] 1 beta subcomplex subunit 4 [Phlebotomus argentipes]
MASGQCDLDAKTRERLLERQKFRLAMREEYLKQATNPHRVAGGGSVFDQGLQRFAAARVTQYDHFKPNFKTTRKGFFLVVLPIFFTAWLFKSDRDRKEHQYRTGQVSYRDRQFKFV